MSRVHRILATGFIAALLISPAVSHSEPGKSHTFGKALTGIEPTTLEKVLAKPEDGKIVRLVGKIDKVCQNKGCWLEMKQGESSVHVTFEDYSFFVPKDSIGKKVTLEGKVKVEEPNAETVKHLKDEGAGEAAARKVSIVALGVEISDAEK